jgi:dTDP-4-dehydrorhamnose reductase
VKTVLRLAGEGQVLRFVDDQIGSPTFAADVADLTVRLIDTGVSGLVHGANEGATSWYGYVGDILEGAGHSRQLVEPISTAQLDPPRPAPRPAYAVLDDAVLRSHGFAPQPHYRKSLERLLERLRGDG